MRCWEHDARRKLPVILTLHVDDRFLLWYKIWSNLPASEMKVLINSHFDKGLG